MSNSNWLRIAVDDHGVGQQYYIPFKSTKGRKFLFGYKHNAVVYTHLGIVHAEWSDIDKKTVNLRMSFAYDGKLYRGIFEHLEKKFICRFRITGPACVFIRRVLRGQIDEE